MDRINFGKTPIGPGNPCFLVAEVGLNHCGDKDLAHKHIDAAIDAGADAVKFQNYRTEDFLSDHSLTYEYVSQGETITESQFAMFKRCELSPEDIFEFREHCAKRGIAFSSTPTNAQGIADLVKAKVDFLKNGSDYLTNFPLIREMAKTGLPTVLSTGMATLAEIDEAACAFREASGKNLLVLHCTSSYPTPAQDVHLRKIPALAAALGCPIGFSDHTWGIVAAVGAVSLGTCFIEKHFTLDKNLPGPDHRFSADPAEFKSLVEAVRTTEKNLGQSAIGPTESEIYGRANFRLSCVAARDLPAGHCLTDSDIAFRRPGTGAPPRAANWVAGRRLKNNVNIGEVFTPQDFT